MRWLVSDIFKNLREINLNLAIKFENINFLEIKHEILKVGYFRRVFTDNDTLLIKEIFNNYLKIKDTELIVQNNKIEHPYPVLNSKFNNFVTKVCIEPENIIKIYFFQKNNRKFYTEFSTNFKDINDFFNILKTFTLSKVNLCKELYRYNQVVLEFDFFRDNLEYFITNWEFFLEKNRVKKFIDKLYFEI